MPSLGKLSVELGAETRGLDQGAEQSERKLKRLGGVMKEVVTRAGALGVAAVAAGAALIGIVASAGQTAREIRNLSQVSNASTREFQRNAAAARSVGIEQEKLADIYKDMNDRVGDFMATGSGPMLDFFENIAPKVGVTAEQFQKLSGPEALQLYVRSLEEANVSQQDMTFYMEAIASDSTMLLPLLRNNAQGMKELGDQAERAGEVLSEMDLQELDRARKRLDDIKAALGADFTRLVADNADAIMDMAEAFGEVAQKAIRGARMLLEFFGLLQQDEVDKINRDLVVLQGTIRGIEEGAAMRRREGDRERILAEEKMVELKQREAELQSALADASSRYAADRRRLLDAEEQALANRATSAGTELGQDVEAPSVAAAREAEEAKLEAEAEAAAKEQDMMRERLAAKVEAIRESQMDELESLQHFHEQKLEILTEALDNEVILEDEYRALKEEAETEHMERLKEIRQQGLTDLEKFQQASFKSQTKMVLGELSSLTMGVASENKRMFELNKAVGVSNAIINAYEGISKTLKSYPYPVNVGLAAAHAAAAFAQVSAIKSQTFGGGGGVAPALAGGTAAPAVSDVGAGGQGQSIFIEGLSPDSLFSGKAVRGLIERINDASADGAKVVIA